MAEVLSYEPPRKGLPISLKAVAWIFIAFGILSAIDAVVSLAYGRLSINLGVLGIFAGRGLLRLSRGWRLFAMVVLWLEMLGCAAILLFALAAGGSAPVRVNGRVVGNVPVWVMAVPTAAILAVAVWQYYVLSRTDVAALFRKRDLLR